ncbi:MAG TPA: zinc ribbon domain-containing protein [Coriobacteriia bacterium]
MAGDGPEGPDTGARGGSCRPHAIIEATPNTSGRREGRADRPGGGGMLCPQCGTDVPAGAKFCPKCGRDMTAASPGATSVMPPAAQPTAAMPVVPPPAAAPAVTATYAPPVATAYAPPPGGPVPPGAPAGPAPAPKKKIGMIIAIVVIVLLLLCCCVPVAIALFVPAVRNMLPFGTQPPPVTTTQTPSTATTSTGTGTGTAPTTEPSQQEALEIAAAQRTVEEFYAALNAADLDAVKATWAPEMAADLDAGWFEGWQNTTFEFTRGWLLDGKVTIIGRESIKQFGSGDDGGVKFTLRGVNGKWVIENSTGVDRTQVEGSDTTGSSSGVSGTLNEATARDLVSQLLSARQSGNANLVRQLTTESFQTQYGDIWLDGRDNREFFLSFKVTGATISGDTATVQTSEDWNSGTEAGVYTVVSRNGALLVDSWGSP